MNTCMTTEEKALYNVVTVYRERGNYLLRLELFEKAIEAYNEALRWNDSDVKSLLGRSIARAKSTHYNGALADAARAAELEPQNSTAQQIRAHTEYEKCSFERALVLSTQGLSERKFPPTFAEIARIAEETVRECTDKSASKVLSSALKLVRRIQLQAQSVDIDAPVVVKRRSRMQPHPTLQTQEMTRIEKQKTRQISRLMASKYLERMAHDKYFLIALCKDERLASANKQGSQKLQLLAERALADLENRQMVLRERRPLYAARASEAAARERLFRTRKEQLSRAQTQNTNDAQRLVHAAEVMLEKRDTAKCLEAAEFAMNQISSRPANLLPGKEKFLQELQNIVGNAFLDQKRVGDKLSEFDAERRAFALLGIALSREPSRDSVLRVRPTEPPRDVKQRLRTLERSLMLSVRASERCYVLHELARLHVETKQGLKARFFASKCHAEARASDHRPWLLNATFLLARCHVLQNNRPEARVALIEGAAMARNFRLLDVAQFFDTCVNVSMEGEAVMAEAYLEKREKDMVDLMQDDDLRSAAKHLFRKMSVIPAARRFSVMPGARVEESASNPLNRRQSINPKAQQPTWTPRKTRHPLGFQEFDI